MATHREALPREGRLYILFVPTKSFRHRIIRENIANIKCRICGEKEDTLYHIIDGYSVLSPKEYTERHDRAGKIVHQNLARQAAFSNHQEPYYANTSSRVLKNDVVYLIDVAMPLASNISRKLAEKIGKFSLANEVKALRKLKSVEIILIIVGSTAEDKPACPTIYIYTEISDPGYK